LLNVEGLGRDLYPELDIWNTASPILREWMRERMSPRQVLKSLRAQIPELLEAARSLPALVNGAVQRSKGGIVRVQIDSPHLQELKSEIRSAARRQDVITIGAAIVLGGLVWLGIRGVGDWPGWALLATGVAAVLFAWRR